MYSWSNRPRFPYGGSYFQRRLSVPTSGSLRRRARERKRAEQTRAEGERIAKEKRDKRDREKREQQRKAREELASYEPWGRAGGGAPNSRGIRFTNLRDKGIFPEDELRGVTLFEACCRYASTPQRRQPRQTPVKLREDPQLCFAEQLRQSVDNDIRYRQPPDEQKQYKEILDEMVLKKKKAVRAEKKQNLEDERQMNAMAGPWGKPGPGGAVWRNPRDIGLNFNKSMGWTDNEIFTKLKGNERRNKRSSLALPDVKRDDGSRQGSPNKENVKPTAVDKLPDINQSPSPKEMSPQYKRHSVDVKLRQEANVDMCKEDKRSPNRNKFVKRLSNGERRIVSDDSYDEDGEIVVPVVKTPTPETAILHVTGGVELVPLLARRRRVGARTLHSSDVTRPPDQSCQWREMINMEYLRDLKHQMRVKCIQKEEKRLNSAESVRRHHETWESLWGRQGHGAPLRGKYARNNLAHLLYSPMANAH